MSLPPISLSRREARRLAIISQSLHQKRPFGRGKSAVRKAIEHLGYVQLDTISVVRRAHHHVLWSRIPEYRLGILKKLQEQDRSIFEYWAHAAAFLPLSDYRFVLPTIQYFREEKDRWPKAKDKYRQHVLERISKEGPLMSRDFQTEQKRQGGWWEWKPAKLALQRLFFEGELMVRHRKGFQRVYDLTERVLPDDTNTRMPTTKEYAGYLIRTTLRAHGMASVQQIAYLRRGMSKPVTERIGEMIEEREVVRLNVNDANQEYFALADQIDVSGIRIGRQMRILSPFDNTVIQRERLRDLFGYDYQIECYVPRNERVYGYFCLPLLHGDRFVGRLDAKADRKTGVLNVINVFKESRLSNDTFAEALAPSLMEFAQFNGSSEIEIHHASPISLKSRLAAALKDQPRS